MRITFCLLVSLSTRADKANYFSLTHIFLWARGHELYIYVAQISSKIRVALYFFFNILPFLGQVLFETRSTSYIPALIRVSNKRVWQGSKWTWPKMETSLAYNIIHATSFRFVSHYTYVKPHLHQVRWVEVPRAWRPGSTVLALGETLLASVQRADTLQLLAHTLLGEVAGPTVALDNVTCLH